MAQPSLPPRASSEYLWWSQGAKDEHDAVYEGIAPPVVELLDVIANLARVRRQDSPSLAGAELQREMVLEAARIVCPDVLKRRHR